MEIVSFMKVFPGSTQPIFLTWSKVERHGYAYETMFLSTLTRTHFDVPYHFIQDSRTVDQLDVSRFVSRAILLTTPKKADQQITRSDNINCGINANDTVVFATGWEKWLKEENYMSNNP